MGHIGRRAEFRSARSALGAATPLGTWIGALQEILATDNTERLRHLTVPTLVLYAIQDDIFSPADEQILIASLTTAADGRGSFWFKQYGSCLQPIRSTDRPRPQPPVGGARGVAADIASFVRFDRPTTALYHTDYPADIHRIVADPGRAVLIHEP